MVPPGAQIPDVHGELVRLYQSSYSTAQYFEIFHGRKIEDCWVLKLSLRDEPKHLLAFFRDGNELVQLNEMAAFDTDQLQHSIDAAFEEFPDVDRLVMNRLRILDDGLRPSRLNAVRIQTMNDAVLSLPESPELYREKLGSQTRKHISYYHNRIRKSFPDFQVNFILAQDILPEHVHAVVEMNRRRVRFKGEEPSIDEEYERRLYALARCFGLLCLCTAGGTAIAGSLCFRTGKEANLHILSHEPDFNRFNPGQICLYNTITRLIGEGYTRFHMLWGQSEYKYRFGANDENLLFMRVYRSKFQAVGGQISFTIKITLSTLLGFAGKAWRWAIRRIRSKAQ